jgi:hypothetical protein
MPRFRPANSHQLNMAKKKSKPAKRKPARRKSSQKTARRNPKSRRSAPRKLTKFKATMRVADDGNPGSNPPPDDGTATYA